MTFKRHWTLTLCVLVTSLSDYDVTASGDLGLSNSTHTGEFSKGNPIEKALEKIEDSTDIEKKERTYIFKKNGEVIHEYVEDHRDIHHGRMEQLIEAWQARRRIIEEAMDSMGDRRGHNVSDILDPNMEEEINYQNLLEDVRSEVGNHSFYDLDMEADRSRGSNYNNNTNNSSHGVLSEFLRSKRTMEKGEHLRWPKAILPYVILEEVRENTDEYKRAMKVYEEKTCVRFVEWKSAATNEELGLGHPGRINFVSDDGCWSYQGNMKNEDGQSISCCGGTTCVHELGHALGVAHEHQSFERNGWIRVNNQNILPDSRIWYSLFDKDDYLTFGYDLSSTMHYQSWGFSSGGPTMTLLFPELYIGSSDYYMFLEIVQTHKCHETPACEGFTMTCENDGYVSVVRGKCACRCPTGLDPDTGCTTPIRVKPGLEMPKGQYSLLKPKTGCPADEHFSSGQFTHVGDGESYQGRTFSLEGDFTSNKATQHFCTRDVDDFKEDAAFPGKSDWPGGSYCILRKGGECPPEFLPGFISYTDVESDEASHSGDLPDGFYNSSQTRLEFCCQYSGFVHNPIEMPVDKPFVLFPVGYLCQEVVGMHARMELYGFNAVDVQFDGYFKTTHSKSADYLYSKYCVYEPADMDCGGVITLDSANPTTFIEINSTGRTDMECTWVVKGPHTDGTLVLEFDEFDIREIGSRCVDTVEVRHARIGQEGLVYCGQDDWRSIRSITDKMMIRFKTVGSDSDSRFKAYVRWIPNEELCYDVEDGGATYAGKVNYTRTFEPCLPWAEVTQCPHHPWSVGDEMDNLEENYCRNPDNSLRPWCYTALAGCKRNYCDVCSLEEPFNRDGNCEQLREEGLCTSDVAKATHSCACVCNDLLPDPGPIQAFGTLRCGPPSPPIDGSVVGELKAEYELGEEVSFTCTERKGDVLTKTCLSNGEWSVLGSVCVACPTNSLATNDSCHVLVNEHVTYPGAVAECGKLGGVVAMPKTPEEFQNILEAAEGNQVWLGLTDLETEGTFVWADGSAVGFANWYDGEPNNWGGGEHCTVMRSTGEWNDIYCDVSWATSKTVCTLNRVKDVPCANFLGGTCDTLLEANPSMCGEFPSHANEFCAKTCGVCGSQGVTCDVAPSNANVRAADGVIGVGECVTYECQGDTLPKSGSQVRGCKKDGTLTGEDFVCAGLGQIPVTIGPPTIEKKDFPIPSSTVFTGENDLMTITHPGHVTAWVYYSDSPVETAFMVWRVVESEKSYELVGKNVITTGNDVSGRYEVPQDERVRVEEGDVIGIWSAVKGGMTFSVCYGALQPGWARLSWSREVESVEDFKVGQVETFSSDQGCAEFSFRAEVTPIADTDAVPSY